MWWGCPPTDRVRTTLNVFGSMTLTVPLDTFGTYTRGGSLDTTGLNTPEAAAAYTSTGPVGDGEGETEAETVVGGVAGGPGNDAAAAGLARVCASLSVTARTAAVFLHRAGSAGAFAGNRPVPAG